MNVARRSLRPSAIGAGTVQLLLLVAVVAQGEAFAGIESCHCYCGVDLRAPCGDEDCKRACGWVEPSRESAPDHDYEAERRRQEEERQRQIEAERQKQREMEEQRRRKEEEETAREAEFDKSKQEVLGHLKGALSESLSIKDGTAPLTSRMKKDIDAAKARIPQLEREVNGLQALLRQFGASQRGNVSEFEKWQETFNAAADNSWETAKEYALSMFLQYNLLGSLERRVQKDAYSKLDRLIHSPDPEVKRWLGEQLASRKIELDRVKEAVAWITHGNDFAALLSDDSVDAEKVLDVLLFVNDLMETTKAVPWKGSQYFQQAKAIGETYTDIAAFALSCANVRKTDRATDAYNREIKRLSAKLTDSVSEMTCLKSCLDSSAANCFDECAGRARFGSPPPAPAGSQKP